MYFGITRNINVLLKVLICSPGEVPGDLLADCPDSIRGYSQSLLCSMERSKSFHEVANVVMMMYSLTVWLYGDIVKEKL